MLKLTQNCLGNLNKGQIKRKLGYKKRKKKFFYYY